MLNLKKQWRQLYPAIFFLRRVSAYHVNYAWFFFPIGLTALLILISSSHIKNNVVLAAAPPRLPRFLNLALKIAILVGSERFQLVHLEEA